MRTVTRTWYNKKKGEWITKTYTYDTPAKKRGGRSLLLVGKNGNKYNDRIKEVLDAISNRGERSQAKYIIEQAAKAKETLSIRSLQSKLAWSAEEKFLLNAGHTRETFKKEYGFDIDEFIDQSNWVEKDGQKLFERNGQYYRTVFDYSSPVLVRYNG